MQFDFEIIKQLKNGEEAAFKIIFNTFYSRLFFFVREYVVKDEVAENIVQESFVTLWDKRKTINNDTNLNAYLYTVSKNGALKYLRSQTAFRKYKSEVEKNNNINEINMSALDQLETSDLTFKELEKLVNDAISSLPPQCERIFRMSRFEDKKDREIAVELGISQKAVEAQKTKALKILKIALKDYLPLVAYLLLEG